MGAEPAGYVSDMGIARTLRARLDRVVRRRGPLGFGYAVFKKFGEDRAGQLAALVAYYGFFSLFPLMLVAVTVLGLALRGDPELQARVLDSALAQFPIIGDQIRDNVSALPRSGVALAIGLTGALWGGMAGMKAMQNALDRVWDVPVKRQPNVVAQLVRGLLMLVVLGLFVLVATGLSGLGTSGDGVPLLVRLVSFPLSIATNVVVFMLAFRILTVEAIGWRDVVPGAFVAGVAWAVLQMVGSSIVANQLSNASATYGFFGVVIGLLSWLYLAAQVTLLAAEVNVVRARSLWPRSLGNEPATEADRRAMSMHAKAEERSDAEHVDVRFAS